MQIEADQLPPHKGSYLLILMLPGHKEIRVGRLGCIAFKRGWYAYAGSAFGPGGLAARISHHLRPVQKPHWHIDYLQTEAMAVEVWVAAGLPCREHDWSAALAKGSRSGAWVRRFGCSDCHCPSHLLHYDHRPGKDLIREKLGTAPVRLKLRRHKVAKA
jgi:Uri superfamily endonuclease